MTDFKHRLDALFGDEPSTSIDVDRAAADGRRMAQRRTRLTLASTFTGVGALAAAVVVPLVATSGKPATPQQAVAPLSTPTPVASHAHHPRCAIGRSLAKFPPYRPLAIGAAHSLRKYDRRTISGFLRQAHIKDRGNIRVMQVHHVMVVCAGAGKFQMGHGATQQPSGPRYDYTTSPSALAQNFAQELSSRAKGFGLTIVYARSFGQESSTLDSGHPSYFDGNVDVTGPNGEGDLMVTVRHEVTDQVPLPDCSGDSDCKDSTLSDGSLLQTSQVKAGDNGQMIQAAQLDRPDGVVVTVQESNYPFGPDATAKQVASGQPLTLDQLVELAKDPRFTF